MKISEQNRKMILAIATISGTTIGVGFFSLPYVASRVGFWAMLGYFFVVGFMVLVIHMMFGDLALKTPDFLRLPGYAGVYLGKWGKSIALITIILGFFGTLLVYIIVGGEFLTFLLSPILGGTKILYTAIYFLTGACLIFIGIGAISKIELGGLIIRILVLLFILIKGAAFFKIKNLFPDIEKIDFFLPYGPLLFSLWGVAMIPEVEEMLGDNKNLLKKIIPAATLIPLIIYILFVILVVGISGQGTSAEAIIGLKNYFGNTIVIIGGIFGVVCTFTAFIALGLALLKVFWYDLKISKNASWAITCFVPFALFVIGFRDFIKTIGLVGGVMLGIDGVLILLMYMKVHPKKIYVYPLILIFLAGIIYEIIYFFK